MVQMSLQGSGGRCQHLRTALLREAIGLKESPHDEYLLYRPGLSWYYMLMTQDLPHQREPESIILSDFDVNIEDNLNEYHGIKIDELPDGSRRMTQSDLIKKTQTL